MPDSSKVFTDAFASYSFPLSEWKQIFEASLNEEQRDALYKGAAAVGELVGVTARKLDLSTSRAAV